MVRTDLDAEREYDGDRFTARTVFESPRSKVVFGYFEPGQFIPVHAPNSDVTIVVQSGSAVVREGEAEHAVEPGDVVVVEAGTDRGIRADESERVEAVLVTAPPPTDGEHDPVRAGLRDGTFDPSTG